MKFQVFTLLSVFDDLRLGLMIYNLINPQNFYFTKCKYTQKLNFTSTLGPTNNNQTRWLPSAALNSRRLGETVILKYSEVNFTVREENLCDHRCETSVGRGHHKQFQPAVAI